MKTKSTQLRDWKKELWELRGQTADYRGWVPVQIAEDFIESLIHQQIEEREADVRKQRDLQGAVIVQAGEIFDDPYNIGLYNGLECALATLEDREPKYQDVKSHSPLVDLAKETSKYVRDHDHDGGMGTHDSPLVAATPGNLSPQTMDEIMETVTKLEIEEGEDRWTK